MAVAGYSYTLNDLYNLNHGNVKKGKHTMLFDSYPPPPSDYEPYINLKNRRFYPNRQTITTIKTDNHGIKQASALSNDKILEFMQKTINSVCKGNIDKQIEMLNGMLIPFESCQGIAKIFHESMIDCDLFIPEYLELLLSFKKKDIAKNVYQYFAKIVVNQFKNPATFTDTLTESGADKQRRWRVNNCLIIANLVKIGKTMNLKQAHAIHRLQTHFSVDKVCLKVLEPVKNSVSPQNAEDIGTFSKLWEILREYVDPIKLAYYNEWIQQIINNREYKSTVRSKLRKFVSQD